MHALISLSYTADDAIHKLLDEQYKLLVEGWPELDLPIPKPADKKDLKLRYYDQRMVDIIKVGKLLSDLGITFEVHKFKNTYVVADHEHTHIHCHIPNVGLLMVDEVSYQEDCCTDRLQQELNDGWRILAVCPPNAQRRPDYILGRTKKQ